MQTQQESRPSHLGVANETKPQYFSQSSFPRLWLLFQHMIGCHSDKLKLHFDILEDATRVVEIGCSSGTIAELFIDMPIADYTGVDIDFRAITLARSRFKKYPQMRFERSSTADFAAANSQAYDLVLISSVAHHVDDCTLIGMLNDGAQLARKGGRVVILDPLLPGPADGRLVHAFLGMFEQGEYLRTLEDLLSFAGQAKDLRIKRQFVRDMRPNVLFPEPVCRFAVIELEKI